MSKINYKVNGNKVPSVTQILGRFKNSTGLIIWSNKLGLEGKSYHAELNKAGDIGTALHELAELHIKGEFYELPEDPVVQECFNKFKDWWSEQDYDVTFTEKSFCCRAYEYGGTADLVVNGDTIIDFKTSKQVYDDHLVQMSAYRFMIEEQDQISINKGILARFGKETDDFEIRHFSKSDLNKGWKYFKVLREAYDLDKKVSELTRKAKKK